MGFSISLPEQTIPIKSMETSEVRKIISHVERTSIDEWVSYENKNDLIHILKKELISRN